MSETEEHRKNIERISKELKCRCSMVLMTQSPVSDDIIEEIKKNCVKK